MLLVILTEKKLFERLAKKNCKKANQKECRIEKLIERKGNKGCVKLKDYDRSFNNWIDKKHNNINRWIISKKTSSGRRVKVKLDLSNYATIANFKNATGADTLKFSKKNDLASLKA